MKKSLFKSLCIALSLCYSLNAYSQDLEHKAPTLQLGLDGLTFGKGSLDAELIAEIIASKQSEIKLKLVQNTFLQKVGGSGGTVYNYIDNVIKGIVEEPNTQVRTKKILESTVNMVFVYSFADYYSKKASVSEKQNLDKLINYIQNSYRKTPIPFKADAMLYNSGLRSKKLVVPSSTSNTLKYGSNDDRKSTVEDEECTEFIATLIDIASEVIRDNDKLRELGLFRVSYSSTYEYMNLYKKNNHLQIYEDVYSDMEALLNKFIPYIGAVQYSLESTDLKGNSFPDIGVLYTSYTSINLDTKIDETVDSLEQVIKRISYKYVQNIDNPTIEKESYLYQIVTDLAHHIDYLEKVKFVLSKIVAPVQKSQVISDVLFTIEEELKNPVQEGVILDPGLIDIRKFLSEISTELYSQLRANNSLFDNLSDDPEPFVRLVGALYEFDKSKTFSEYRSLLTILDEVFENGKINDAISKVNTFVKDYITINEDENGDELIHFNVESFLVKLQNMESAKIRRLQFHFTVGMNTGFFNKDFRLDDSTQIRNLSFVSEKIGLKYKIISKGDWWPRSPGSTYGSFGRYKTKITPPKEPLISNWHVLLYGSGILYNAVNTTTQKEFNYPLLGVGTGLTFYNSLDLNTSVAFPLLPGGLNEIAKYPMFSFGFDIQFTEYLTALNKKRQNKKIRKDLIQLKDASSSTDIR